MVKTKKKSSVPKPKATRRKTKKKTIKNPALKLDRGLSIAEKARVKAEKELTKQILARKNGTRVAYDKLRAGTITENKRRIVKCSKCRKNGELSDGIVWGASILVVHRARIKDDNRILTDFCVCSRVDLLRNN